MNLYWYYIGNSSKGNSVVACAVRDTAEDRVRDVPAMRVIQRQECARGTRVHEARPREQRIAPRIEATAYLAALSGAEVFSQQIGTKLAGLVGG